MKYLFNFRIFDDNEDGYITVCRFRQLLKDIDKEITEEELEGIIAYVSILTFKPEQSEHT